MPDRIDATLGGAPAPPDAELVLGHLAQLPMSSEFADALGGSAPADNADRDRVVEWLRAEPAVATKVLAWTAPAGVGDNGPITRPEDALALLGPAAVRGFVLSIAALQSLARPFGDANDHADLHGKLCHHLLATACAARHLASAAPRRGVAPPLAFTAGLLHDLGKLALSAVFPKAYARIAMQADRAHDDIADFERRVLGVDHTVAGRHVAERWRLPRELVEVIWLHHLAANALPSSVINPAMIELVRAADVLAREQRLGYSGNHVFCDSAELLCGQLGIPPARAEAIARDLAAEVVEHARLFGLAAEPTRGPSHPVVAGAPPRVAQPSPELPDGRKCATIEARYFRALSLFEGQLTAGAGPPAVVAAMARAAASALQRSPLVAFGVHRQRAALDLCWVDGDAADCGHAAGGVPGELAEWLREPGESLETLIVRAPAGVAVALGAGEIRRCPGPLWLVPLVRERQIIGGLAFWAEADERARLETERDELRAFVAGLTLALEHAQAQAAARRLSDELAEATRRLQRAQVERCHAHAISLMAEMAAGAAHEINSPLTVISGRAQMLEKSAPDPEARRALAQIREKAHECSRIISELMDFARPTPLRLTRVDLVELLAEVRAEWLAETDWPPAALQLDLPVPHLPAAPTACEIRADHDQLKVALRELLANAADAVAENRGAIVIGCQPLAADGLVEITVHDSGCGMTPDVLQRAFGLFFSHRRAGRSRGLGLPRVHRIVHNHGGRVWLDSAPRAGTTAHVLLPVEPRSPADEGAV